MSKTKIIESKNDIEETTVKDGKIGTMLHDVRIKKNIDIEDVSNDLHIKKAYLIAIEESDYANIPESPYGIGFIRSYASFLGLNSSRIVQLFKEETKQPAEQTVLSEKAGRVINSGNKEPVENIETYMPNRKYILISLGMLLIFYVIWNFLSSESIPEEESDITTVIEQENNDFPIQVETYSSEEEENESIVSEENDEQINMTEKSFVEETKQPEEKTSAETEKEIKKAEPAKTETSSEKPTEEKTVAPKKTGRVVLKIKKETWVEVKDEDKLWISKVLKAGDEYILPENGVGKTVSFGNTDGVDVLIDGKVVTIVSNSKKTNIKMDPFLGNH